MHAQRNRTINKIIGVLFNKVYSETPLISIFFDEVSWVFVSFVLTLATVPQLFDLLFFFLAFFLGRERKVVEQTPREAVAYKGGVCVYFSLTLKVPAVIIIKFLQLISKVRQSGRSGELRI